MNLFKQIRAIFALPFMVLIVIPFILFYFSDYQTIINPESSLPKISLTSAGIIFLICGLIFLIGNIVTFAKRGKGTLAPWDPPAKLVVSGMYKFVRNPMITGVMFILIAESLLSLSSYIFCWTILFILGCIILIPIIEEPQLEKRFGEDYRLYKQHVRRWIPRLTGWEQKQDHSKA